MRSKSNLAGGRGRPVIYLDFDGVLHPEDVCRHPRKGIFLAHKYRGHKLFEHAEALEREVTQYPGVGIVLSTTWVRILGFTRAAGYLPTKLRERVIGATYHSAMATESFLALSRGQQVVGDAGRRKPSAWIAVDDDDSGWPAAHRSHLLKTDVLQGLPTVMGELRAWLQGLDPRAHSSNAALAQHGLPLARSQEALPKESVQVRLQTANEDAAYLASAPSMDAVHAPTTPMTEAQATELVHERYGTRENASSDDTAAVERAKNLLAPK